MGVLKKIKSIEKQKRQPLLAAVSITAMLP